MNFGRSSGAGFLQSAEFSFNPPPALEEPGLGEVLGEGEVKEIAGHLLALADAGGMDHVIGALMTHAAGAADARLGMELGGALGGLLRSLARQTLPTYQAGGAGRGLLGMELEEMGQGEAQTEMAERFVRLAAEAVRNAAENEGTGHSDAVAAAALEAAAEVYAPGALSVSPSAGPPQSGRWVRMPGRVVLIGAARQVSMEQENGEAMELSFERFEYDPEMEYFLGKLVRSVGRFIKKAAKAIGRIPVIGDIARAGLSAARLAAGPAAIAVDTAARVASGQKLGDALRSASTSHLNAARDQLKLAQAVASFVPGVGTGVAAALGAANALASGRPITEALIAAARSAMPGGAVAQAAFDTAVRLA